MIIPGKKIGYWTVIEKYVDGTWRCRCICGVENNIPENWLLSGFSTSCGCHKNRAKDLVSGGNVTFLFEIKGRFPDPI